MEERQERLAQQREEIAARVANFKATQDKFKREREAYYVTTLQNACSGSQRLSSLPHSPLRFDVIETGI